MPFDRLFATGQSREQVISTTLLTLLVSSLLLAGAVGTATATTYSSSDSPTPEYGDDTPLVDESEAVDNSSVVVNGDGNVVSGKQVGYGEPVGKLIRVYWLNGLEKTESVVVRDDNVVTRTGQNVIVEGGGSVGVFDETPDIRARYDNGTVEKVVVNGSNIETESGRNVKTEEGENVEINRNTFNDHEFVIDILNTSNVGEGEVMEVTVKVGNIGHESGEEIVDIEVDGRGQNPRMLELDPGETQKLDLQYFTRSKDAPGVELTAKTPDDSDTVTAPIDKPDFRIDIQSADRAVSFGEEISVSAVLNRIGGSHEKTYAIDFLADGSVTDTELVSLERGGKTEVNFTYKTNGGDVPSVLATVSGPGEAEDAQKIAVRMPILAVDKVYPPKNVSEYEKVDVTAKVENYGTDTKNQTVQLATSKNGTNETTIVDKKRVKLGNRSEKNVTFAYHTKPEYHPQHKLTVSTPDHNRSVTVKTNATAVHKFETVPKETIIAPSDEKRTLKPTIKNIGHANGTAKATFKLNGSVEKTINLSVEAGKTASTKLDVEVPQNASVKYKIAVQHDETNGTIAPQPSATATPSDTATATAESGTDTDTNATATPGGETDTNTNASTTAPTGNSGSGGGGLLGFLPSVPVLLGTGFTVVLVGLIAHAAS
jgi:hypothetical protein